MILVKYNFVLSLDSINMLQQAQKETSKNKETLRSYVLLILQGIVIGAANAVPGVSGGTMALIFGIYEELIASIKTLGDKRFWQAVFKLDLKKAFEYLNWRFLLPIAFGVFVAILLLAQILEYLLEHKASFVWSFFFGLIAASVLSLGARVKSWRFPALITLLLGAIITFGLVGLTLTKTPENPIFLFISGALAASAFILPGISGALILVLLGKYEFVLNSVNQKDILSLLILALGGVIGLVIFARFLNWLFKHHHDFTIALLTGSILGSLRKVWPWQTFDLNTNAAKNVLPSWQINGVFNFDILYALLFVALGFLLVILIDPKARLKIYI